jgi:16S rRNA (guanine966-N2)-methyltransferase
MGVTPPSRSLTHSTLMRIVGGTLAGRELTSPADHRVRPTAEHMRSALLELLEPEMAGARILDLYAGTGALGLEAISRGAISCDFVEWRPTSLLALKSNITRLKLKSRTRVFKHDAIHFAEAVEPGRYDIAFCDPPYESRQLDWVIRIWEERRVARVLAVEHAVTHLLPPGHSTITSGGTRFTIYRDPAAPGAPAASTLTVAEPAPANEQGGRHRVTRRPPARRR